MPLFKYLMQKAVPLLISLTDMAGKLLWQSGGNRETQIELPVQQFAAGIYLVTVTDGQNKKTVKLIKQ